MTSFAGRWLTSFGPMILEQDGRRVHGTYGPTASEWRIEGTVDNGMLVFTYAEAHESGSGWFRVLRPGAFKGEYMATGTTGARSWQGWRGFDGLWESSFGRLRLIEGPDGLVTGHYESGGAARIEGRMDGNRLVFRYEESKERGEGILTLDDELMSFTGEYLAEGKTERDGWVGRRAEPEADVTWLVVLEAHWQNTLAANEFAFGHMLREVFARTSGVRVRQRFFGDEPTLMRWCREALYLAEPCILVIASHGEPEGLSVHGEIIDTVKVIDALRPAETIQLLHFSSCLIGVDGGRALSDPPFVVSGYTTSVDWGASALIEFTYLDLILEKGLKPPEAAEWITRLIGFAGDQTPDGSPYPAAGFRCIVPSDTTAIA